MSHQETICKLFNEFEIQAGRSGSSEPNSFFYSKYTNPEDAFVDGQDTSRKEIKDLLQLFSKAINFKGSNFYWNKGWTFFPGSETYSKRFGQFILTKNGEYKLISPGEFITENSNPEEDATLVSVKVKKVELITQPSGGKWLYVNGKHLIGENSLLRIYFNFNFSDVQRLFRCVAKLITELNRRQIPFDFKMSPYDTNRSDSGVLYFQRSQYAHVFYVVNGIFNNKTNNYPDVLRKNIPLFTQMLFPGIGFAENPEDSTESFGQRIAKTLTQIFQEYKNSGQNLPEYINASDAFFFQTEDLYRNAGTNYPYCFDVFHSKAMDVFIFRRYTLQETKALSLGWDICNNSIFISKGNSCFVTWMTFRKDELLQDYYTPIDDSFENGKLGILYFLAELAFRLPNELFLRYILKVGITQLDDVTIPEEYHSISAFITQVVNGNAINSLLQTLDFEINEKHIYLNTTSTRIKITEYPNKQLFVPGLNGGYSGLGLALLVSKSIFKNRFLKFASEGAEQW